MLPGRDEADLMRRRHKGEKVKTTFSKQADLCVQMYEVQEGILTNVLSALFFIACILFS